MSLRIPLQSEIGSESKDADEDEGPCIPTTGPVPASPLATTDVMPALAALKPSVSGTQPIGGVGAQLPPLPKPPAGPGPPPGMTVPAIPAILTVSPAVMPVPSADPLDEAPHAVWYVRPPSGGQYGPARGDLLRKWITEGRVSGDSMVWREGWGDWQPAAKLFPSIADKLAGGGSVPPIGPGASDTTPMATPRSLRRERKSIPLAVIVLLGVVSLILIGVLAFAIFNK